MYRSILLLDNNCLDHLGPYQRDKLKANLRATGREYWPTSINVLEALQASDPETRKRLLETIADLADDHIALTLPGEALKRIAQSVASGGRSVDWSEPATTRFFRFPDSVTEEEVALAREHLLAQERNFNGVHQRARQALRPHIRAAGGMERWGSPADFIDEFWSRPESLQPYIEHLWREWELAGKPQVSKLLSFDSWRLYFDGWGAATFARAVEHPQRGIVQSSDLGQLSYLGAAHSRILATGDIRFRVNRPGFIGDQEV